jgi:hypothetical protein
MTINEVENVPYIYSNLFSYNMGIKNGFSLSNEGSSICLTKESATKAFDRVIKIVS